MNSITIQGWLLYKCNDIYSIPYTQWIYLSEIRKYYNVIYLMSPVKYIKEYETIYYSLPQCENIRVIELPYNKKYISAIKYIYDYIKAFKYANSKSSKYYVRYPNPYGWMSKIFIKNNTRIIHYVGDPLDAAKNNPVFNLMKKQLLIHLFKFEYRLYIWACKGSIVYTNGYHIAEQLSKHGIHANPVISSTLIKEDYCYRENTININSIKILYVGGVRTAKGVDVLVNAFRYLVNDFNSAQLTIVGEGDNMNNIRSLIKKYSLDNNILLKGHIDDRKVLNELYRNSDIFWFASYSEGSPRVILEANANSLPVISTPVGSLPTLFVDNEDILYFSYGDHLELYKKTKMLIEDEDLYCKIKHNGYKKAKSNSIETFIKKVFGDVNK